VQGRELLAAACYDQTVRLWDPATGTVLHMLKGHTGWVHALCPVGVQGRELLAAACDDQTVRLWDPATGAALHMLKGHTDRVHALCPVGVQGRELLAAACGDDQTVRLWDPATGALVVLIPTSEPALALAATSGGNLVIGTMGGLLALRLRAPGTP
jgi:WD40 repeat protein